MVMHAEELAQGRHCLRSCAVAAGCLLPLQGDLQSLKERPLATTTSSSIGRSSLAAAAAAASATASVAAPDAGDAMRASTGATDVATIKERLRLLALKQESMPSSGAMPE